MSKIQFEYEVTCDLHQALQLASEIDSEMGMTPTAIVLDDGTRVKYNQYNILLVVNGDMTEMEYIQKYIIE